MRYILLFPWSHTVIHSILLLPYQLEIETKVLTVYSKKKICVVGKKAKPNKSSSDCLSDLCKIPGY